jgi:hypothetical protein
MILADGVIKFRAAVLFQFRLDNRYPAAELIGEAEYFCRLGPIA